jgi:hypothetical protein
MLSTIMELVPFVSLTVKTTPELVLDITQPTAATQFDVMPQKKKSVPLVPILGLKNSVMGEHRESMALRICPDEAGFAFRTRPVNPKEYLQGVVSAAPVPQRNIEPLAGLLK